MKPSSLGPFNSELWEADEYIITCKAGPIGHTIGKDAARWLPQWLNMAMAEAEHKIAQRQALDIPDVIVKVKV